MNLKVDITNFVRSVDGIRRRRRAARHAALRTFGNALGSDLLQLCAQDTHRFVRGHLLGLREVGHYTGPIPALTPSKYVHRIVELLEGQVRWWGKELDRRERAYRERFPSGKTRGQGKVYTKMHRDIDKAEKQYRRAKEELAKFQGAPYGIMIGFLHSGYTQRGRELLTVRPRPYGGVGRVFDSDTRTDVRLLNMEPHAAFRERADHSYSTAFARARRGGRFDRVGDSYRAVLRNAANLQGAARERFLSGG